MKKINLLLVISSLSSGGAERVLVVLANELAERSYDITIVTICRSEIFYELDNRIKLIELDLCGNSKNKLEAIARNMKIIKEFHKYFKATDVDVIISFMTRTNILAIIANLILKKPIIISEHFDYSSIHIGFSLKLIQKIFYKYASSLVCVSRGVEKNFNYLEQEKKIVIYNPIEKDIVEKSKLEIDKIDIKLFGKYIISVGRLEEQKKYDILIKSFSLLENKKINLVICGEGSLLGLLNKLIKDLRLEKRVFLIGRVKNPYYFMSNAELFVLSSLYEGFGNVLIESMACATPCISYDCPSGPAEIIKDDVNGILVENQNIQKLAYQMQRVLDDEIFRERLSKESAKVKDVYNIEIIANEWEELVDRLKRK